MTPADAADAGSDGELDSETDAWPLAPPSCAPGGPGMTDCGGDAGESCCTSLEVEGGTYYRTYASDDAGNPTGEADPATVSAFRLDKYLVTVGRFRQFVNAVEPDGGAPPADAGLAWTPDAGSGKHTHLHGGEGLAVVGVDGGPAYEPGWLPSDDAHVLPEGADSDLTTLAPFSTWTSSASGGHEDLPINGVTWAEAYAFCIWDGGFLPSEAEWEYAAAGGSQQREYPWGSTSPGTSNAYAIYGCYYGPPGCNDVKSIAPVGTATLGAGAWGQLDLAGEVFEWTLDSYESPYASPCTDCVDLSSSYFPAARVTRGGDFGSSAALLPSAYRNSFQPFERSDFGFRCARTP